MEQVSHSCDCCEIIGKWVSPPSFGAGNKGDDVVKGVWSGKRSHCWAQIEFLIPDLFSFSDNSPSEQAGPFVCKENSKLLFVWHLKNFPCCCNPYHCNPLSISSQMLKVTRNFTISHIYIMKVLLLHHPSCVLYFLFEVRKGCNAWKMLIDLLSWGSFGLIGEQSEWLNFNFK